MDAKAKYRVVVVGLGSIGRRHARLLLERPDIAVEVIETNPGFLAAARGELGELRSHPSLDACLEGRPDIVWLATPTPLHADQTITALAAGALVNSASRYQATQAGSLFFDYAHQPDLFYWLLGRAPRSVWAAGFQGGRMEHSSTPNVIDMICEFDGELFVPESR